MSTVKNILNPTVVYATDRSKEVVPVLFLILCSFVVYTTGRLIFLSLLVLFVLVSPFVLAFSLPRLRKRELVFPLSLMNRLNKTESAIFKFWMLCFQRIPSDYLELTTAVVVPCGGP